MQEPEHDKIFIDEPKFRTEIAPEKQSMLKQAAERIRKAARDAGFEATEADEFVKPSLERAVKIERMLQALNGHPALKNFTRSDRWLADKNAQQHFVIAFPDGEQFLDDTAHIILNADSFTIPHNWGTKAQRHQRKLITLRNKIKAKFNALLETFSAILHSDPVPGFIYDPNQNKLITSKIKLE